MKSVFSSGFCKNATFIQFLFLKKLILLFKGNGEFSLKNGGLHCLHLVASIGKYLESTELTLIVLAYKISIFERSF